MQSHPKPSGSNVCSFMNCMFDIWNSLIQLLFDISNNAYGEIYVFIVHLTT